MFTVEDAACVYGGSRGALYATLTRLCREGWLDRICHGTYVLRTDLAEMDDRGLFGWSEAVAATVHPEDDEYVTLLSALDEYALLLQPVRTIFIRTPRRRKSLDVGLIRVRYVLDRTRGERLVQTLDGMRIATIEQAIVDCLRHLNLVSVEAISQAVDNGQNRIDWDQLHRLLTALGKPSLFQRLGYICDRLDLHHRYLEAWSSIAKRSSAIRLSPDGIEEPRFVARWRVYDNEDDFVAWRQY